MNETNEKVAPNDAQSPENEAILELMAKMSPGFAKQLPRLPEFQMNFVSTLKHFSQVPQMAALWGDVVDKVMARNTMEQIAAMIHQALEAGNVEEEMKGNVKLVLSEYINAVVNTEGTTYPKMIALYLAVEGLTRDGKLTTAEIKELLPMLRNLLTNIDQKTSIITSSIVGDMGRLTEAQAKAQAEAAEAGEMTEEVPISEEVATEPVAEEIAVEPDGTVEDTVISEPVAEEGAKELESGEKKIPKIEEDEGIEDLKKKEESKKRNVQLY